MNSISNYSNAKTELTLKQKIGQLFMPAAFVNDSEEEIQRLEKLISEHHIGSVCFFHSRASAATNFEGKKKIIHNAESFVTLQGLIKRYQKAAKYPLLIAIDAEWGLAMRIENTPQYPYAITLGAIQHNEDLIFKVGKNIAEDCKAAGIHWNLAPCVDINNNPYNPVIGYRSFGANKKVVAQKALAFVKGTESAGVLTSIKHFPGHGDTATDSHLELPLIKKNRQKLFKNELYPFQKLIDEGIDSVMVGHLSVPALTKGDKTSSSISKEIIKGVLRKEMKFTGVVISDALNMHAISKKHPEKGELEWLAFDAGNDVLCFAENPVEGIQTILKNASGTQIEESFKRVWSLKSKAHSSKPTSKLSNSGVLNREIAQKSITLYHGTPNDVANFRKTDFLTLEVKPSANQDKRIVLSTLKEMDTETKEVENILLFLTPPQVKPTQNFGFLDQEIDFLNGLLKHKNVVLYLMGNPYVLNHLETSNAKAVIIVYQNFKEFKDVAKLHFEGKLVAYGKLPIVLSNPSIK